MKLPAQKKRQAELTTEIKRVPEPLDFDSWARRLVNAALEIDRIERATNPSPSTAA
jgi:hypothetical protein